MNVVDSDDDDNDVVINDADTDDDYDDDVVVDWSLVMMTRTTFVDGDGAVADVQLALQILLYHMWSTLKVHPWIVLHLILTNTNTITNTNTNTNSSNTKYKYKYKHKIQIQWYNHLWTIWAAILNVCIYATIIHSDQPCSGDDDVDDDMLMKRMWWRCWLIDVCRWILTAVL